jgi:ABC-type Fe3+/spermidine/putrescine transport system ATPase subunit
LAADDDPSAAVTQDILTIEDVSKRFGSTQAANELSLSVLRGEFFTFLGPSGSGKSTILRMVAGLEQPDRGRILIDGRDVAAVPPWRRNLGMVFQQYAVFPHMTVAENVAYGLKVRGQKGDALAERVRQMLEMVGLSALSGKNVTLLSGGEQQRVALARALAPQPRMLLLDEPLSALDEKIRRSMQVELKQLHRKTGTTFLYVTHDQEEALTMSDRIAVINQGKCIQCDAPELLYKRPRTRFVAGFFRGCNVLKAEYIEQADGRAAFRIAGTLIDNVPTLAPAAADGHIALRAENVQVGTLAEGSPVKFFAGLLDTVYRGTVQDYLLRLEDGQQLVATTTRRLDLRPGNTVMVGFEPEAVIALED